MLADFTERSEFFGNVSLKSYSPFSVKVDKSHRNYGGRTMVNYTPHLSVEEGNQLEQAIDSIMDKKFVWFDPAVNIEEAIAKMARSNITGGPVLNEKHEMIGFLSQKDCLRYATQIRYYNDQAGLVSDCMSEHCFSLHRSTSVAKAIQSFIDNWFYSYPVVDDDGTVIGLITRGKVLNFVHKQAQTCWKKQKKSAA